MKNVDGTSAWVLTDIRLHGGWELPEPSTPDLHAGETLSLPLRGAADAREIEWEGRRPDGSVQVFRYPVAEQVLLAVPLLWVKRRIEQLCSEHNLVDAIDLSRRHNLVCAHTAFVAWDEVERIVVGQAKLDLYQPAMETGSFDVLTRGSLEAHLCVMSPPCADTAATISKRLLDELNELTDAKFVGRLGKRVRRSFGRSSPSSGGESLSQGGPLIHSPSPAAWRAALELDELFRGDAAATELLAWFEQWAVADPAKRVVRAEKLRELAELLVRLRHRQELRAGRLGALRNWLEATLRDQPEFLRPVLATVERMASTVPA